MCRKRRGSSERGVARGQMSGARIVVLECGCRPTQPFIATSSPLPVGN